jgi:GAF domain-containing protein
MLQATKKRRGASRKPLKARLRKPAAPKRRRTAGASRGKAATASELRHQLEQRARELKEARDQQTATSEVLSIISRSPGDLKSVFDAILKNATRLCDAKFGNLLLYENGAFRRVALYGAPRAWAQATSRQPVIPPNPVNPLFRIVRTRQVVHIPDMKAEQVYLDGAPDVVGMVDQSGARTIAAVPMIRDEELVGAIAIYRQEVRPFTAKQIEVVKNFAAEAVIAIENARLLNELRQRTADLTESLEQQTATAEVLRVISNSLSKLDPVFDTILANATKLCAAHFGMLALHEDGAFRSVAMHNVPQAFAEQRLSGPIRFAPKNPLGRLAVTKAVQHVVDVRTDPAFLDGDPGITALARLTGARTLLVVPMLKDDNLVGAFGIYRQEVRAFSDKQIDLVRNFANQAVIAIENTRLLNELRQRTVELTESLEQQTATSEVLQVISSSPGDLQPVFEAMLEKAVRICDAKFGNIYARDGNVFRLLATHNTPPGLAEHRKRSPIRSSPTTLFGRMMTAKAVVHVVNLPTEKGYIERVPETVSAVELGGIRTVLAVPMLKEDELVGAFNCVSPRSPSLHGQADRLSHELRRSSRHRHRKYAAIRRTPPAHLRPHRVTGAADCDRRRAARHRRFSYGYPACPSGHCADGRRAVFV